MCGTISSMDPRDNGVASAEAHIDAVEAAGERTKWLYIRQFIYSALIAVIAYGGATGLELKKPEIWAGAAGITALIWFFGFSKREFEIR